MERRFERRVGLVTGGSRGIGRACSLRLAAEGARVAINCSQGVARAEQVAAEIRGAGGEAIVCPADVRDEAAVQRMVDDIASQWGPVELLVNSAGVLEYGPHEALTLATWRNVLDVNLTGTFIVSWAVKPAMVAKRFGRIVNVASIAGLRERPQAIAYAASKAGVISLTKSLGVAVAGDNVRVNAVAPGLIDTEMISEIDRDRVEAIVAGSPIPRLGTPDEIAAVVAFLLSEESSFMTGQTVAASGGRVLLP